MAGSVEVNRWLSISKIRSFANKENFRLLTQFETRDLVEIYVEQTILVNNNS
jgi:hypothetical protein